MSIVKRVGCELFGEDSGLQFFDPRGVLVELHLYDVVEAAIDVGKAFVHVEEPPVDEPDLAGIAHH